MAKVKLNLRDISVPDKVQYTTQIVTALTGNANFPTPSPTLALIQKLAAALEDAYNDANTTRQLSYSKTAFQNQQEAALDAALTALGNYVESTSNNDEALIKSAGMSIRAKSVPVGTPVQVQDLSAIADATPGEVILKWKNLKDSKSYVVRHTTDITDNSKWVHDMVVTKATATISGLVSGTNYWFQVAAVGAAGQGPWSDPATRIAG